MDDEDVGEIQQFSAPNISLERWLDEVVDFDYGERVAEGLKKQMIAFGVDAGRLFHHRMEEVGRQISDAYGEYIMKSVKKALRSNVPVGVDTSEFDAMDEADQSEFWDDSLFTAAGDASFYFIGAMMPYILSAIHPFANGMDYGFPMPISDEIKERTKAPEPPAKTAS